MLKKHAETLRSILKGANQTNWENVRQKYQTLLRKNVEIGG